jgi:spore germination protein YaaH
LAVLLMLLSASGLLGYAGPAAPVSAADVAGHRLLGYYVPYDPTSWTTLEAQAANIDIVAVQWVTIDACGRLTSDEDQTLKQFARSRGIQVYPSLLTNAYWLNHRLLTDDETTARAIAEIVAYVEAEGYDGFDLDLEAIEAGDRAAYTGFVSRLADALHGRGKTLALAIPAKDQDTTTGWAGAYDYAALGALADLVTVMAYEFHGAWGEPGPVAPYGGVERVAAFATAQMPSEKVLLGVAFYGFDWNTTSGGARYLGSPEVAAISERYGATLSLDPESRSATLRYQAPAGDRPPTPPRPGPLGHDITRRVPPTCTVPTPTPRPTPVPTPTPAPEAIQQHVVWLEESGSAASRLELAERYRTGGIAAWRLGHEDRPTWDVVERWRSREQTSPE